MTALSEIKLPAGPAGDAAEAAVRPRAAVPPPSIPAAPAADRRRVGVLVVAVALAVAALVLRGRR
jgi:hypothetical protein